MNDSASVKLKSLRPLLEAIQPLEKLEADELPALMQSLLDRPSDTSMRVTSFVILARAIEAIAAKRSSDQLDTVKRTIQKILSDC